MQIVRKYVMKNMIFIFTKNTVLYLFITFWLECVATTPFNV
jgi:hypothetical protein